MQLANNDDYCIKCGNPKLYPEKPCPICEKSVNKNTFENKPIEISLRFSVFLQVVSQLLLL